MIGSEQQASAEVDASPSRKVLQKADMDFARQPANLEEDLQHIQLQHAMNKLQLSLAEYFCEFLRNYYHGIMCSLQESSYLQIERLRRLNWEQPNEQEQQTASCILKKMEVAMLSDSALHGRETAPNRVLLNIFKGLWTYFRLHQGVGTQRDQAMPLFDRIYGPRRRYHDQERGENVLCETALKEDCQELACVLQQQTRLLTTRGEIESIEEFNPSLNRILTYLRHSTIGPHPSRASTSYESENLLEDLDWILR